MRNHGYPIYSDTCNTDDGCMSSRCGYNHPYQVKKHGSGELALLPKCPNKRSRRG